MELSGYLAVARRWWWTLLVATWIAAVSGFVFASQIPPTYESRVQLLVGPYNSDTDTLRAAGQLVQTYAELVTTQPLLESAIAEVGGGIDPLILRESTRVIANDTTRFLTIWVQSGSPEVSRDLANALADEIIVLASRGTSRPEGQLQIVDFAQLPLVPIAPQVSLIVGLAAMVALIGALVLVMLVEYFSASIRTPDDVRRLAGVPYLGRLDALRTRPSGPAGLIDRLPESAAAASYRLIAAKASFGGGSQAVTSIIVVGTGSDVANAQVAANLAAVVARGGRNVILVDGDTTDGDVTTIFRLDGRPGLHEVLADRASDPGTSLYSVTKELRVLPRGATAAFDGLDVERAAWILARLETQADMVVVSAGPLHLAAGALVWARAGGASLLVTVRDRSRRDDVTYASESLRLVGVQPTGAVLVDRRRSLGRSTPTSDSTATLATMATPMGDAPEPTTQPRQASASPRSIRTSGRGDEASEPAP